MAIRFSNGFGIGASNNGGGNLGTYGTLSWRFTMNISESNTTAFSFAGVPFSQYNTAGYANGWNNFVNVENSGAQLWEYTTVSYQEFSTPQTDLYVEGDSNYDISSFDSRGLTVIGDALVGISSSPVNDSVYNGSNYSTDSSTNVLSASFGASTDNVVIVCVAVESGTDNPARSVTNVTGGGLTWIRRSFYTDPRGNCGQRIEVWYAINNTGNAVEDNVIVTFNGNFDDGDIIVSSWAGCNLSSPWTSSGYVTSNNNGGTPGGTPTPTPTPAPITYTDLPGGVGRYSSGVSYSSNYNPFGPGSSYVFDGNSGYIEIYGNSNTVLGTGDFTIEWFQFENTHNSHARIFAIGQYPSATLAVSLEGLFYLMENGNWVASPGYGYISQTWVHFAIVRISGTTTIYKDGQSIYSFSDSNNLTDAATHLHIGQESPVSDSGAYFNGAINNFRWTKGLGIYTGNFTVPTGNLGFTASANPFGGSNTEAIPDGYVKYILGA